MSIKSWTTLQIAADHHSLLAPVCARLSSSLAAPGTLAPGSDFANPPLWDFPSMVMSGELLGVPVESHTQGAVESHAPVSNRCV